MAQHPQQHQHQHVPCWSVLYRSHSVWKCCTDNWVLVLCLEVRQSKSENIFQTVQIFSDYLFNLLSEFGCTGGGTPCLCGWAGCCGWTGCWGCRGPRRGWRRCWPSRGCTGAASATPTSGTTTTRPRGSSPPWPTVTSATGRGPGARSRPRRL